MQRNVAVFRFGTVDDRKSTSTLNVSMSGRSQFHHHTLVMADGDPNITNTSTLLPSQTKRTSDSSTVPRRGSMSLAVVRASACFPLNFHYTQDPTKRLTHVSQVDLKRIVAVERKSTDSGLKMA